MSSVRVTKHISFLNHNYFLISNFLWAKCFSCLLSTKNDLLKHLETHAGPPETEVNDLVNVEQDANNRCPRCSKKFSYRKSLARHIKESRCQGRGDLPVPSTSANTELEIVVDTEETRDIVENFSNLEEEEDMDVEASLKLGCPTSLFRFGCTHCSKMFKSYANMCRHRQLSHGRYGICSPEKTTLQDLVTMPVRSPQNLQNSNDLTNIVHKYSDNLNQCTDGKNKHLHSVAPIVSHIFKTCYIFCSSY